MDIAVHDLLEITGLTDLISHAPVPEWVKSSLDDAPFVVVRRARSPAQRVAVGIRGKRRNERFPAYVRKACIIKKITPEQLAAHRSWKQHARYEKLRVFRLLDDIDDLLQTYSFSWGPTGSIGFELASGRKTVTENSDIDIVIRRSHVIPVPVAESIHHQFEKSSIKIDALIETPRGAFSLAEYVRNAGPILVKTREGPVLKKDPWK